MLKSVLIFGVCLFVPLAGRAALIDLASPAIQSAAKQKAQTGGTVAAASVVFDLRPFTDSRIATTLSNWYLHNVLAVTHVGPASWIERTENAETPRVTADYLPANAPFHLPVVGTPEDAARVRTVLVALTNALPQEVRTILREKNALAPILQWFIRRNLPGLASNGADYLSARAHPVAFMANHFDKDALTAAAARLSLRDIPPISYVMPVYEEYEREPLRRMQPGRDFPDLQPEETFATPFAIAYVLRAPETVRRFRFCARTWGGENLPIEYAWTLLRGRGLQKIQGYVGDRSRKPDNGFAEIIINRRIMTRRLDVGVFSRVGHGPWGPPAVISFYQPPDIRSDYYKSGQLRENNYVSSVVPGDPFRTALRSLYTPRDWIDTYDIDAKGQIGVIARRRAGSVFADQFYRPTGEKIIELGFGGFPKKTVRVAYFVNAEGLLDYREEGAMIVYPQNR